MAKVVYTAEATVTGGREKGHGKTTDGALEVDLHVVAALGHRVAAADQRDRAARSG